MSEILDPWSEQIDYFSSSVEFKRFAQWLEGEKSQGVCLEMLPIRLLTRTEIGGEQWYIHRPSGEVWSLLAPDYPPLRSSWQKLTPWLSFTDRLLLLTWKNLALAAALFK
jgi:hypothetical protein